MKTFLIIVSTTLLAGCISTEHSSDRNRQVASTNGDGIVCKREKPTGSHRAIKICRTVAQIEIENEEAKETARRIRSQSQVN